MDNKKKLVKTMIEKPVVITIIGKPGSGKTCTGMFITELIHTVNPQKKYYIMQHPRPELLPKWIKSVHSLSEVPPESVLLIDEADLFFDSRRSMTHENVSSSRFFKFIRQNEITAILITQGSDMIDRRLCSGTSIWILKQPSLFQMQGDRIYVRKLYAKAKDTFDLILDKSANEGKKHSYICSDDFEGAIEMSLPTFWNEQLSCAYRANDSYKTPSSLLQIMKSVYHEQVKKLTVKEQAKPKHNTTITKKVKT